MKFFELLFVSFNLLFFLFRLSLYWFLFLLRSFSFLYFLFQLMIVFFFVIFLFFELQLNLLLFLFLFLSLLLALFKKFILNFHKIISNVWDFLYFIFSYLLQRFYSSMRQVPFFLNFSWFLESSQLFGLIFCKLNLLLYFFQHIFEGKSNLLSNNFILSF